MRQSGFRLPRFCASVGLCGRYIFRAATGPFPPPAGRGRKTRRAQRPRVTVKEPSAAAFFREGRAAGAPLAGRRPNPLPHAQRKNGRARQYKFCVKYNIQYLKISQLARAAFLVVALLNLADYRLRIHPEPLVIIRQSGLYRLLCKHAAMYLHRRKPV